MRTEIVFHPAKTRHFPESFRPIRGFATAFGLVLHRSLSGFRARLGYWDVSDVQTGALVAWGELPGIEGAVAGLVHRAMEIVADSPHRSFGAALATGRMRLGVSNRLVLSGWPGGEFILVDDQNIAELYAGLNATAVKMYNGTEYLVHEAAEVIRQRVHDRTGISVPIV